MSHFGDVLRAWHEAHPDLEQKVQAYPHLTNEKYRYRVREGGGGRCFDVLYAPPGRAPALVATFRTLDDGMAVTSSRWYRRRDLKVLRDIFDLLSELAWDD